MGCNRRDTPAESLSATRPPEQAAAPRRFRHNPSAPALSESYSVVSDGPAVLGNNGKDLALLDVAGRIDEFERAAVAGGANIRAMQRIDRLPECRRGIFLLPAGGHTEEIVYISKFGEQAA